MKKVLPFIFCFFVVFYFIKLSVLHASCQYNTFLERPFEYIGEAKIRCSISSDYLSSLRSLWPNKFVKDNKENFNLGNREDIIWDIFKEKDGDLYVLRNRNNENAWKKIPSLVPPMLILEENSDGTFKIKNYYLQRYVVFGQDGYLTITDDENIASDFIFEPINIEQDSMNYIPYKIPTDEYDDLKIDFDLNFCNIA